MIKRFSLTTTKMLREQDRMKVLKGIQQCMLFWHYFQMFTLTRYDVLGLGREWSDAPQSFVSWKKLFTGCHSESDELKRQCDRAFRVVAKMSYIVFSDKRGIVQIEVDMYMLDQKAPFKSYAIAFGATDGSYGYMRR